MKVGAGMSQVIMGSDSREHRDRDVLNYKIEGYVQLDEEGFCTQVLDFDRRKPRNLFHLDNDRVDLHYKTVLL